MENTAPAPNEVTRHAQTYHRFMLGLKWLTIHLAVLVTFFTLWFCTPAGFIWALAAAIAISTIGVLAMTHGLAHSTERDNPT